MYWRCAEAIQNEGWWYEGGGIYRHTWLVKTNPVNIAPWGVFVSAAVQEPITGATAAAEVTVQTSLANQSDQEASCTVESEIQSTDGQPAVIAGAVEQKLPAGAKQEVSQKVKIPQATLWSLESPHLYQLVSVLKKDGEEVDRVVTPFGIRAIRFDRDKGFFLNDKPVKIKGTCNHQDFAGIGIALPDRVHAYKIEKLKEMGANGYRCSHHPSPPNCSTHATGWGCWLWTRTGIWAIPRKSFRRSKAWSFGTEPSKRHPMVAVQRGAPPGNAAGEKMGTAMKQVIQSLDRTRPVTAAMNGGYGDGLSHVVDVQGFNYHWELYEGYHKDHPAQPMFGSESASVVTTRGIYQPDDQRGYMNSYTTGAETNWRPGRGASFYGGTFIWTGFDYRGEPSPFSWPCINSHFGVMDTCGFPKDDYYYYQAWWGNKPVLHLVPNWNWAYRRAYGTERGHEILVRAYSNCDRVELFLNGKSFGAQDMPPNSHLDWYIPWTRECSPQKDSRTARKWLPTGSRPPGCRRQSAYPRTATQSTLMARIVP